MLFSCEMLEVSTEKESFIQKMNGRNFTRELKITKELFRIVHGTVYARNVHRQKSFEQARTFVLQ